jgi:hypothetical protein
MGELELATRNMDLEADEPDMDTKYQFIVVTPPSRPTRTRQEFWRTTRGVQQDAELISLLAHHGSSLSFAEEEAGKLLALQDRFGWSGGVSTAVVPGYCADFNGIDLFAVFDDRMATSAELLPSDTAGHALMLAASACRGVVVFAAMARTGTGSGDDHDGDDDGHDGHDEEEEDGAAARSAVVSISRRDILLLAEHNHQCSALDTVSARVHFENIRRAESLLHLKATGFTVI